LQETVLAPDAFQGTMAEGEIELTDETASAEGEQLLAESDDLLFIGLPLGRPERHAGTEVESPL
jgi:hypothetical protein